MASTIMEVKTKRKFKKPADNAIEITTMDGTKRKLEEMETDSKCEEDAPSAPVFPADKTRKLYHIEERRVRIPQHRMTPLRNNWKKLYDPLVTHLKLAVKFNPKTKIVHLKTTQHTEEVSSLQKASDFIQAFAYGFEVDDALALIRLHDLYLETFDVNDGECACRDESDGECVCRDESDSECVCRDESDGECACRDESDVKLSLQGDHMGRAVGRIAGKGGKTRFTLENATKTRLIIADSRIHILGAHQNIAAVRRAICNLILGSPPSKVFGNLKAYASKIKISVTSLLNASKRTALASSIDMTVASDSESFDGMLDEINNDPDFIPEIDPIDSDIEVAVEGGFSEIHDEQTIEMNDNQETGREERGCLKGTRSMRCGVLHELHPAPLGSPSCKGALLVRVPLRFLKIQTQSHQQRAVLITKVMVKNGVRGGEGHPRQVHIHLKDVLEKILGQVRQVPSVARVRLRGNVLCLCAPHPAPRSQASRTERMLVDHRISHPAMPVRRLRCTVLPLEVTVATRRSFKLRSRVQSLTDITHALLHDGNRVGCLQALQA
ncbi:K domain type 1 [Trinorchestia longiramus]|nr:K domain type 1 [Trinorchestia longiramus]